MAPRKRGQQSTEMGPKEMSDRLAVDDVILSPNFVQFGKKDDRQFFNKLIRAGSAKGDKRPDGTMKISREQLELLLKGMKTAMKGEFPQTLVMQGLGANLNAANPSEVTWTQIVAKVAKMKTTHESKHFTVQQICDALKDWLTAFKPHYSKSIVSKPAVRPPAVSSGAGSSGDDQVLTVGMMSNFMRDMRADMHAALQQQQQQQQQQQMALVDGGKSDDESVVEEAVVEEAVVEEAPRP